MRRRPITITLTLVAIACSTAGCGGSSSAPGSGPTGSTSGGFGTATHIPVPATLRRLPLADQYGKRVDLASWPGRTVLLVPFLTLCQDICPLTTGNLLQVDRSLRADHGASNVEIVELSVDPARDTAARLAAYAKLTGADWELVTEPPAALAALTKFFGFSYQKVPERDPHVRDWWTGKPLNYDVDHSDNYVVIDPSGVERVVNDAAPDFHRQLNPRLYRFLDALGRQHLEHVPPPAWTPADALRALGLVLHRSLPVSPR